MKKWTLLLSASALLLAACGPSESPSSFFEKYNQKVIAGLDYDTEMGYYTQRKQEELEASFPKYMQQMNKSRDEVKAFYQKFSQRVSKCQELRLKEERVDDDQAYLVYDSKDTCSKAGGNQTTKVRLIKEDGWKIDDVEIVL